MKETLSTPQEPLKEYMKTDFRDNERDSQLMESETVIMDLPEVQDIPGQQHIRVMPLGEMADTTISSADEEGAGLLDFDEADDDDDLDDDDDDLDDVLTDEEGDNSVVIDTGDEDFDEDEDLLGDDDIDDEDDLDEDLDEDEDDDDDITMAGSMDPSANDSGLDDFEAEDTLDDATIDADITPEEIELLEQSGPVEADSDTDNLNRSKLDDTDMEGEQLNEVSSGTTLDGSDLDSGDLDPNDPASEALGQSDEENSVYSMADTE